MAEKKKIYTAVAAVVVVVVLIGAAFVFLSGNASGTAIKANVNKDCAGTPWFVGMDIGYFEAYGVDFVDKGHLDVSKSPAAFAAGQTNVFDGHPNTIINLLEAGAKIKAVIAGGDEPEGEENLQKLHMHWLVKADSKYDNFIELVKDYKYNKSGEKPKVAIAGVGICADLENNAWLRANGLSVNDITQITLADPLQQAALERGEVDVIIPHPPFYTAALASTDSNGNPVVKTIGTSSDAFGTNAGTTLVVFSEDFIKKNPDTVRKFIQAYKAAERWSNDHPKEAGELTAKKIGLKTATTHWYSYTGEITDELLQPWIDAMVADGIIPEGKYKPSDLYTDDFSDLWIDDVGVQPLNPFNSETNQKNGWLNKTNDVVESNIFVADLQRIAAGDVVNHYAAVGNIVHVHPLSGVKE